MSEVRDTTGQAGGIYAPRIKLRLLLEFVRGRAELSWRWWL
ncbi:MAG TPA: hypothetical protein VF074_04920 [Pyrinomonadaceae bacterium]